MEQSFFRNPVVAHSGVFKHRNSEEIRNETLAYRGIEFKVKDLIDMRSIIH